MGLLSTLLLASLASSLVTSSALPLETRQGKASNVIDHNDVKSFPQTVPGDQLGVVYVAYQPTLKVVDRGCVPFPAVDKDGKVSGGLSATGIRNGGCSKSLGQIYVRSFMKDGYLILLYTWYFPKNNPVLNRGHRHDWQGAAVVLENPNSTDAKNVKAVCTSDSGRWTCSRRDFRLTHTSPRILYDKNGPSLFKTVLTKKKGGKQPLIAWDCLPQVARDAISNANWDSSFPPITDAYFPGTIAKIIW
ncbi:hypothetical protein QTJ16_006311 [Diplocarpon rosae]|uniref:Necrosis inducing protein n=1 Tax=Diplocarpon rosae TaxID=946125 RepID=A0AAD9WCG5_9HELO|nr:hypothetical protein QTJ16_006311 [Diplocarpon rosae]PBP28021.1 hypothetical protein BUE80_DR000973 [Diplocarpon rosae]